MRLETENLKICNFYNNNPSLDFETVNLMVIDLFERIASEMSVSMNSQLLVKVDHTAYQLNVLTQALNKAPSIVSQLDKLNRSYIDSIKIMYEYEPSANMEECNIKYIDKIKQITKDLPADTMKPYYQYVNTLNSSNAFEFINQFENKADAMVKSVGDFKPMQNQLLSNLNQIFNTAEIADNYKMKRDGRPDIIFENNDTQLNVTMDEVRAFAKRATELKCNGIYLSQYSGISSKPNFHIETNNGVVMVYVHNVEYSNEKIKIAVDIIDNMAMKLETTDGISKELLNEINKEFQTFLLQKEVVATSLKESLKKVDEMRLPSLDKYLSTKFTVPSKQCLKCDLCNHFMATNLKAMAAHKRGCVRKTR